MLGGNSVSHMPLTLHYMQDASDSRGSFLTGVQMPMLLSVNYESTAFCTCHSLNPNAKLHVTGGGQVCHDAWSAGAGSTGAAP